MLPFPKNCALYRFSIVGLLRFNTIYFIASSEISVIFAPCATALAAASTFSSVAGISLSENISSRSLASRSASILFPVISAIFSTSRLSLYPMISTPASASATLILSIEVTYVSTSVLAGLKPSSCIFW